MYGDSEKQSRTQLNRIRYRQRNTHVLEKIRFFFFFSFFLLGDMYIPYHIPGYGQPSSVLKPNSRLQVISIMDGTVED